MDKKIVFLAYRYSKIKLRTNDKRFVAI